MKYNIKHNIKELELKLQNSQILTTEELNFLWNKRSGWGDDENQTLIKLGGLKNGKRI